MPNADAMPPATVYSIYRFANAPVLHEVVRAATDCGWSCALWALDEVAPLLASWTLGQGPGAKFGLLRELLAQRPPLAGEAVVVVDDDVRIRRTALMRLLPLLAAVHADVGQPAHGR